MLKLIYLARRKPGLDFDQFVRRWRQHGALGMQQPFWRQALCYVQAEPILPTPIAGASEDFDAVAYFMLRDATFDEMTGEDNIGSALMAADELETFSAPIPSTSLWVDEETIKAGERGGITAFLFFEDASTAATAAAWVRDATGLERVILNRTSEAMAAMNTLPFATVLEVSAPNLSLLSAALQANDRQLLATSELTVVTREAVLWDRLATASPKAQDNPGLYY